MFKGRNCLIFILLLVFLIGCSHENITSKFPGKRGDVVSRGFGLQVEFLNNQPPREIFLTPGFDSSVPLSLRVTNLVPVSVKSITKNLAPSGSDVLVSLKIVIVNVGNGKITNNDEKINDLIVSLDGDVLNCVSTNNKNSLKQGNFEVRCDVRRSPVFETPLLQISYNYGYKIKSSLPISIVLPED